MSIKEIRCPICYTKHFEVPPNVKANANKNTSLLHIKCRKCKEIIHWHLEDNQAIKNNEKDKKCI